MSETPTNPPTPEDPAPGDPTPGQQPRPPREAQPSGGQQPAADAPSSPAPGHDRPAAPPSQPGYAQPSGAQPGYPHPPQAYGRPGFTPPPAAPPHGQPYSAHAAHQQYGQPHPGHPQPQQPGPYPQQPGPYPQPQAPAGDGGILAAMLAHLGGFVVGCLGWVPPLAVYLARRDASPFVRHHASEAANFQITLLIPYAFAWVAFLGLGIFLPNLSWIGSLLIALVWILSIVLGVIGASSANKGTWYRYPVSIRLLK